MIKLISVKMALTVNQQILMFSILQETLLPFSIFIQVRVQSHFL